MASRSFRLLGSITFATRYTCFMNNKHKAMWAVVALFVIFLGIFLWYMVFRPAPITQVVPIDTIATTTPVVVSSEPVQITENSEYYELDATYPSATPLAASAGAAADAAAVARLRGFAQESLVSFKKNNDLTNITPARIESEMLTDGRMYAIGLEYKLHEGPKTITYVYQIYENTLGAHPNANYRTFTFDRATGAELSLGDLFTPGSNYLSRISERTRTALPGIMAKIAGISASEVDREYINTGTEPKAESFQSFAIDGSNLIVIFPPYQVAPYVYGRIDVTIPLSELNSLLKEQYRI